MNAKRIIAGISALLLLLTSCKESGSGSETEKAALTAASIQETGPVTEEQPAAEPITLTLASYSSNYIPVVNEFNTSQPEYHIEIVDYSKDNTVSKENALKQINAELASGEGPDLFYLWKLGMSNAIYGSKGYLEDLLPYIDQDPELSREDFVESLLEGAKIDGKLYGTIPSFSIFTMFGPESQLSQYQLGTFSDLLEVAQTHGGMSALLNQDYDATSFLYTIVQIASDEFIDFGTMTADFDNDNFRALLNLCLQFDDASSTSQEPGILNLYTINSFMEVQYYEALYGEPIIFVGCPGATEANSYFIDVMDQYGINVNSAHKEGAWRFIRMLFTEEYQVDEYVDSAFPSFPSSKKALQALEEKSMSTLYDSDEEGNQWEMTQRGEHDGFDYHAATQAQVDQVLELINGASKTSYYTSVILSIVREEGAAFVAGDATEDQTIEKIQNRVNTYLSEQK